MSQDRNHSSAQTHRPTNNNNNSSSAFLLRKLRDNLAGIFFFLFAAGFLSVYGFCVVTVAASSWLYRYFRDDTEAREAFKLWCRVFRRKYLSSREEELRFKYFKDSLVREVDSDNLLQYADRSEQEFNDLGDTIYCSMPLEKLVTILREVELRLILSCGTRQDAFSDPTNQV
ncbi:uncharacterized protein LOC123916530 [Trifolium pratense]|uniref:uncharacterized protein LOC123916530 n=1 Tax=Trifolium pratense TaxID=57577 RepID=UPI001E695209|nr:uncharacterized protein LOC123916530 [Trifolium pratense]